MKKSTLILAFLISVSFVTAQSKPASYSSLVKRADSLYKKQEYAKSASTYSEAFKVNGWKGTSNDRYNAACSWAQAGKPDSAFYQLNRIAALMNYSNYTHITADKDLVSLHTDKRWEPLLEMINQNKEKAEANYNKPLVAELDSIYKDDQSYRKQISAVEKEFGNESNEMKALWKTINEKDSINVLKVTSILDKYGWLGADVVSPQGNMTLFLVIQHSDQATQEKYLPMMREAVKNGKAQGSSLALLEDRVALGQGKRQVYGSQVGRNPETQKYYILPLEDPDNVDKRRASVGLQPLAEYVIRWNITWDPEQYKKDLSEMESKQK
jgi:hypothetical protein